MATDWNALTAEEDRAYFMAELVEISPQSFTLEEKQRIPRNMIEASAAIENAMRDDFARLDEVTQTRPRIPRDAGPHHVDPKARGPGLSNFFHTPAGYSRALRRMENVEKPCAGPWPTVKVGSRSRAPAPRRTATPGATYAPRRCRTRRV